MLIPWIISEWLPACTAQGRTLGSRYLAWLAQPFTWQLWQCGEGFICVPGVSVGMQSPEHPSHPESLQEKTTSMSWDGDRGWHGHSLPSGLAPVWGQTGVSWDGDRGWHRHSWPSGLAHIRGQTAVSWDGDRGWWQGHNWPSGLAPTWGQTGVSCPSPGPG